MNYRRSNHRSHSARAITAKFAGKCFCCGGDVKAGELADYIPATRQIGHYKAASGDSERCYTVLRAKQENFPITLIGDPGHAEAQKSTLARLKRDPGFVDLDLAYEDQCADICGR